VTNAPASDKSIAVLPFANMSDSKDNAFFADGIHEDVLTTLASLHDLRVVSRTSVEQYRGTTKSMRQIAQELGVAYVLEGSVRRAGQKVRVTGQLIKAGSDEHVWARSYDRDLSDIFKIQSELATEIAGSLRAVLSPGEKSLLDRRPTENLAAYDLYLKARGKLKNRRTDLTRADAQQALEEAVKLDPKFASAWGYLAQAHALAVFNDEDHSPERLARAKAAMDTALALAPEDPDVILTHGNYYYYGFRDYSRAAEQYQRLLLLRPNSAETYVQLGYIQRRQAHWPEALANLRRAVELDPRNITTLDGLYDLSLGLRRYNDALAAAKKISELADGDVLLEAMQFTVHWLDHGATREAEQWVDGLKPKPGDERRVLLLRISIARGRGDWAGVLKLVEKDPYPDPYIPHWAQDVGRVACYVGANDMPSARALAAKLVPVLKSLLEKQPENTGLLNSLACMDVLAGDKEQGLQCADKAVALLPESADAASGPDIACTRALLLAWIGRKDEALAELTRLLRTPYGPNVYSLRIDPMSVPLRGDPRFEALLKDPANNAPLLQDASVP